VSDYERGFQDGLKAANTVAYDLENRWRSSAQKIRRDGTFTTGWPFRREYVAKKWEQSAKDTEAAADGIKAIRSVVSGLSPDFIDPMGIGK